jgi:hypothetical protein
MGVRLDRALPGYSILKIADPVSARVNRKAARASGHRSHESCGPARSQEGEKVTSW